MKKIFVFFVLSLSLFSAAAQANMKDCFCEQFDQCLTRLHEEVPGLMVFMPSNRGTQDIWTFYKNLYEIDCSPLALVDLSYIEGNDRPSRQYINLARLKVSSQKELKKRIWSLIQAYLLNKIIIKFNSIFEAVKEEFGVDLLSYIVDRDGYVVDLAKLVVLRQMRENSNRHPYDIITEQMTKIAFFAYEGDQLETFNIYSFVKTQLLSEN